MLAEELLKVPGVHAGHALEPLADVAVPAPHGVQAVLPEAPA